MLNVKRITNASIFVSFINLLFIYAAGLGESYSFMLFFAIFLFVIYGLLVKHEMDHYHGFNLNLIILFAFFMRLVLPCFSMASAARDGETFYYNLPVNDVSDYIYATSAWINIFYMLFYKMIHKKTENYTIDRYLKNYFYNRDFTKLTIILFVLGAISMYLNVATSYIMLLPSFLATFLTSLTTLAILIQVLSCGWFYTKKSQKILIVLVLSDIVVQSLFSFSKHAIIIPLILYALFYFVRCKECNKTIFNFKNGMLVIVIYAFFLFIVYPFMGLKRIESGFDVSYGARGGATAEYSNVDILQRVLTGDYEKVESQSNSAATDRYNAIIPNAFFYKDVCIRGRYTWAILKDNLDIVLPSFLRSKSHAARAGLMATAYVQTGSFNNYKDVTTNTYIGQFASSYMLGGPIFVIVLALLNGWIISIYYKFLLRNSSNILALFFFSQLLIAALMGFEEIHDAGLLRATGYLGYALLIIVVNRIFNIKPKKQ